MSKPISKMTRTEAEAVIAQEYSTRRIGAARKRIALLNPITREQILADFATNHPDVPASVVEAIIRRDAGRVFA